MEGDDLEVELVLDMVMDSCKIIDTDDWAVIETSFGIGSCNNVAQFKIIIIPNGNGKADGADGLMKKSISTPCLVVNGSGYGDGRGYGDGTGYR
jgi:hypothetical protein